MTFLKNYQKYFFYIKNTNEVVSEIIVGEELSETIYSFTKKSSNDFPLKTKIMIDNFMSSEYHLIRLKNGAEGFLMISPVNESKKPIIAIIHGGPFSFLRMVKDLRFTLASFLNQGYNILLINFRGSTGYGQDMLESLIG